MKQIDTQHDAMVFEASRIYTCSIRPIILGIYVQLGGSTTN